MKEKSRGVDQRKEPSSPASESLESTLPAASPIAATVTAAVSDIADTAVPRALDPACAATAVPGEIAETLPPAVSELSDTATPAPADIVNGATLTYSSAGRAHSIALPVRDPSRYRFHREIARGGMGRIISVRDLELGRDLAIKEQLQTNDILNRRFEREIRITTGLQHPAIITALEAGCWPGGELFFTMNHVDAEPFDVVIEACKSLPDRLALLPNLVAVVEALAYAHDHQIIHRDLKPANVLIGSFGETVVIDWGLAKDLSLEEPDEALPSPAPEASDKLTMLGQAMGTPAYMPPEQAKGATVDERADVYALGAMLYHLLTGKAPYEDSKPSSAQELLDRVKRNAPTALAEIEAGAPPDLLAIVDKAMERSVDARYPTALELAQDLRRFAAGQLVAAHSYSLTALLFRWVKKHKAAVAVAVVMGLVLIAGGIVGVGRIADERDLAQDEREQAREQRALAEAHGMQAEEQRQAAEKSHSNAEELLQVMLVDLYERLEPIGRLDILDVVFEKAGDYYDGRALDFSRRDEAARRALFQASAGHLMLSRDKPEEALALFQSALAIQNKLVELDPTEESLEELAEQHTQVAAQLLAKDKTAALRHYKLAAETERSIGESAIYFERLGDYQKAAGTLPAALQSYASAIALLEDSAPEPVDRSALAMMHIKSAEVLFEDGDTAGAATHKRVALDLHRALAQDHPGNVHRYDLAMSHDELGFLLAELGKEKEALKHFRLAVDILEKLVIADPANIEWQKNLEGIRADL